MRVDRFRTFSVPILHLRGHEVPHPTEPNRTFLVLYYADYMYPAAQAAQRRVDLSDLQIQAPEVDFRSQTVSLHNKFCFFFSRASANEGFWTILARLCLFRAVNVAFRCFWDLIYPPGTPRAHWNHQEAHPLRVGALFFVFGSPRGRGTPRKSCVRFCAHNCKKIRGQFFWGRGGQAHVAPPP